MTTISPTLIAARYPLCLDDDTLMNDDQLIRYVRGKCGDDVADVITDLIYANSIQARLSEIVSDIQSEAEAASNHLEEAADFLDELKRLVNRQ